MNRITIVGAVHREQDVGGTVTHGMNSTMPCDVEQPLIRVYPCSQTPTKVDLYWVTGEVVLISMKNTGSTWLAYGPDQEYVVPPNGVALFYITKDLYISSVDGDVGECSLLLCKVK